jgi:mannosyltransferase OCH1-like enzyme
MIPKIIHHTYKSRDDMPKRWLRYREQLLALHPDWKYNFWTDEESLAFVKSEFPDMLDIYVRLPKNIMRVDIIRYMWLYRLGGLYMDMDYEMLRPFAFGNEECVLAWEIEGVRVANSIMASAPGHPFFKAVLDDLKANPPLSPDLTNLQVMESTGPHFISRVLLEGRTAGANWNICTPKPEIFNPPTPRSPRQNRKLHREGISHGIHQCTGTWVEYTFPGLMRKYAAATIRWIFT